MAEVMPAKIMRTDFRQLLKKYSELDSCRKLAGRYRVPLSRIMERAHALKLIEQ